MADMDGTVLRFDVGAVTGPPFGVWRPIGEGVEVMARAEDTLGTLWVRSVGKVDVVREDGTHEYWSTHCRHATDGEGHRMCAATTINGGPRNPAQCRICSASCRCDCHKGDR